MMGWAGRWLAASALPAAVAGCALLAPGSGPPSFPLLPPASLGHELSTEQVVRVAYADRNVALQCVVTVTRERITLQGFTALAQHAFRLAYDGHLIESDGAGADAGEVPPERILADLQLAWWPLPALQAATAGTDWQVSEPRPGTRRVRHRGELHTEIHYAGAQPWGGRLWLVNFAHRYSLDIETRKP